MKCEDTTLRDGFPVGLTPRQGGHTLFPLAQRPSGAAPVGLGELLLEHVQHTGAAPGLEAAVALTAWAERLAAAACQGFEAPGLAVAPLAGRCVAFWSRDALGRLEAAAWHGGAATQRPKWTLQPLGVKSGVWNVAPRKFREAPVAKGCCVEAFAARHKALRLPCFGGGVRFEPRHFDFASEVANLSKDGRKDL